MVEEPLDGKMNLGGALDEGGGVASAEQPLQTPHPKPQNRYHLDEAKAYLEDMLHAARTPDASGRPGVIHKHEKGRNLVKAARALTDIITAAMKTIDTRVDQLLAEAEREVDIAEAVAK